MALQDEILYRIFFYSLVIFRDSIHEEIVPHALLWLLTDPGESANSVLSVPFDEKLRAMPRARMRCSEYSLMMISRGEVLSARRCSIARVAAVEGVLREETGIVLVHSTGPESRAFREIHPGTVLRLHLGLHGRWRPFQVSSHIACCRSFRCCGLSLVHRCWCLRIKNESGRLEREKYDDEKR